VKPPYEECNGCIATKWCKRYSGEAPKPESPSWCNPKFRLYKALGMSNIPNRYLNANLYNYQIDEENEQIADRMKQLLDDVVNVIDEGRNFIFRGVVPGTGKTYHGIMVLNHFIYKTCLTSRMDFENPLAYYIGFSDLMDKLRYYRDDEEIDLLVEKIKNVPVLMLDDVGAGTVSDYMKEQTYLIVNHRYNNGLSTIYTTNFTKQQLLERLNSRILSRMFSNCEDFKFEGKTDRRR
jgi:DNA replication protein DnaC